MLFLAPGEQLQVTRERERRRGGLGRRSLIRRPQHSSPVDEARVKVGQELAGREDLALGHPGTGGLLRIRPLKDLLPTHAVQGHQDHRGTDRRSSPGPRGIMGRRILQGRRDLSLSYAGQQQQHYPDLGTPASPPGAHGSPRRARVRRDRRGICAQLDRMRARVVRAASSSPARESAMAGRACWIRSTKASR
jgi:hypothetical protein